MSDWSQAVSAHKGEAKSGATMSGSRGLQEEEPLLLEQDAPGRCGVDLPEPPAVKSRLGGVTREGAIGLPGLSEPQVVRHYMRISQKNYAIDTGIYPLGSCTMKHNPRLNEKLARLPGFGDVHPLQPVSTGIINKFTVFACFSIVVVAETPYTQQQPTQEGKHCFLALIGGCDCWQVVQAATSIL